MSSKHRMFRQAALRKMESPDRLDEMMQVTAPAGWAALAALAVLILAAVLWGFFGSISMKVEGRGILIRGEAVLAITSGAEGRVDDVAVRRADERAGEVVVHFPRAGYRVEAR